MTPRTAYPFLSARQLNRATLARQLLLERATLDVVTATERIGGLQAQEPASPYIGLWTRLAGFRPADLDRAIAGRAVVKGTLMRSTLHLVSAADYLHLWPAVVPLIEGSRRQDRVQPPSAQRLAALTARAEAFTAEPRGLGELRDHLGASDGLAPDEVVWWIRRRVAFAHAPSDVPWSFGRRPRLAHALTWLGADAWPATEVALERLVRRYLGAFGPATTADLAQWSGVAVGRCDRASPRWKRWATCVASMTSVAANCSTSTARRCPTPTRPRRLVCCRCGIPHCSPSRIARD